MAGTSVPELAQRLFSRITELSGGEPESRRADIQKLREQLTSERSSLLSGYMNRAQSFFAYLNYHFPLHLPEIYWILEQNRARLPNKRAPESVLDLGCGPGTATLSLLLWLAKHGLKAPREFHLFDISQRALNTAEELVRGFAPEGSRIRKERSPLREGLRYVRGPYDWVLLSHVLNEFGNGPRLRDKKLEAIATIGRKILSPGGCALIVEPPLREPTMDLMWLRDQIAQDPDLGLEILAPCPSGVEFCPLAFEKKGWCYTQPPRAQLREVGLAPWDRRLERTLGIELTQPGFSYLLLKKTAPGAGGAKAEPDHALALSDANLRPGWVCIESRNVHFRPNKNPYRGAYLPAEPKDEKYTRNRPRSTAPREEAAAEKAERPAPPVQGRRADGRLEKLTRTDRADAKRSERPRWEARRKPNKRR